MRTSLSQTKHIKQNLLLAPASDNVVRILPPLNITKRSRLCCRIVEQDCTKVGKLNNFLDIKDLNLNQITNIFDVSAKLKKDRKGFTNGTKDPNQFLLNRVVALLFKKPSTRTRFSFEVGIFQMGGNRFLYLAMNCKFQFRNYV